jgi:DNA-binding PadR family transcriptional regulator
MLDSPSSQWSGSAGAIYPLLARFEKRGLVRSRRSMRGDRAGWLYTLTAAGRERFRAWLGPPLTAEVVSITADPLRTRVYFLKALSSRERAAFFASARAALEQHLEEIAVAPALDEFDQLALRGAMRLTRARLAWLDEVRRATSVSRRRP